MNALKEAADNNLSATGPQASLAAAEAAAGSGLTLNTKPLFKLMVEKKASDLFITAGVAPSMKVQGRIVPITQSPLSPQQSRDMVINVMTPAHIAQCYGFAVKMVETGDDAPPVMVPA